MVDGLWRWVLAGSLGFTEAAVMVSSSTPLSSVPPILLSSIDCNIYLDLLIGGNQMREKQEDGRVSGKMRHTVQTSVLWNSLPLELTLEVSGNHFLLRISHPRLAEVARLMSKSS